VSFVDRVLGPQSGLVDDFVVRRNDGAYAYNLAVVVDDADQGITHVVRGADLLASTPRQIWLQRALRLPTPSYLHHPVAILPTGEKLSKQTGAEALPSARVISLAQAWSFLGQGEPPEPPRSIAEFWRWAKLNWTPAKLPPVAMLPVPRARLPAV
jgi:glutamyl-Q tRNA(Asp) synthetase